MSRKMKRNKSARHAQKTSIKNNVAEPVGAPGSSPINNRIVTVCALLLAVATFAVYSRTFSNPFVNFDDPNYVTENRMVQQGLTRDAVRWAITTTAEANWHPLTWLSHELDCQLFALRASGHHLTSVLLHTMSVVLLFLLVLRATGSIGKSLALAGLFALHPINVESVAWISERKNVLSMFFFLLTVGAYGWYARKPGIGRYLLMAVLFALGLAAKPMIVTTPFVLLLLDIWPLQRVAEWPSQSPGVLTVSQAPAWRLALEKLPLLVLSAASSVITMAVQKRAIEGGIPVGARIANTSLSYVLYVVKTLFPINLAAFYPYRGSDVSAWQMLLCVLALAGVTVLVFRYRSRRYLLVGWLWFLGTLVPMIGLVQVGEQGMADRYAYLPIIGLFLVLVWGGSDLLGKYQGGLRAYTVAGGLVIVVLSVLTWRQIGTWRSNFDLWSHTLHATTDNYLAENYIGEALTEQHFQATGERFSQEGAMHFLNAVRINPRDPSSRLNLGAALHERGELQDAVQQYQAVLQMTQDPYLISKALIDLGAAYHQMGDYQRSQAYYLQALKIDPGNQTIFINLGKLAMDTRIKQLAASVTAHPSAQAYLQLGQAQQAAAHIPEARQSYELALKLNPKFSDARAALDALGNPARR